MSFIELTLAHNSKPILINMTAVSSVCVDYKGTSTVVSLGEEEDKCVLVKETYEEVKALILNAEKA